MLLSTPRNVTNYAMEKNYYQFTQNDVNWHGFISTVVILDCQHFSTCTQSLVLSSSPEVMALCGVISLSLKNMRVVLTNFGYVSCNVHEIKLHRTRNT